MSKFIKPTEVKKLAHNYGKRVSASYLFALDVYIEDLIYKSLEVHNGGSKTLDAQVLGYVTPKKTKK